MITKNTEVKVWINGSSNSITVLVPVEKSKMQVIQSVKSKAKSDIQLAHLQGDDEKANAAINRIGKKYKELVGPVLKDMLPGIQVKYTEANSLMSFDLGDNTTKELVFDLDEKEEESEES